jgi:hypothetical protein
MADQDNTTTLVVVAVVVVAAVMYSRRAAAAPAAGRGRVQPSPTQPPDGVDAASWVKAATGLFSGIAGLVDKFDSEPDTRGDSSQAYRPQSAAEKYSPSDLAAADDFCRREGYDAVDADGNPTKECLATYLGG